MTICSKLVDITNRFWRTFLLPVTKKFFWKIILQKGFFSPFYRKWNYKTVFIWGECVDIIEYMSKNEDQKCITTIWQKLIKCYLLFWVFVMVVVSYLKYTISWICFSYLNSILVSTVFITLYFWRISLCNL